MSIQAINYALNTRVGKASEKLVLLCLANYADENGLCYPSQAALQQHTELDRKTVIRCVQNLVEAGFLFDTEKRVGTTKQIPVYRITFKEAVGEETNSPKNGTVPKTEQSQISRETVPNFPLNSPKNGTRNHQGTIKEPSTSFCEADEVFSLPPEIPKALWQRFESHRKRIKEPLSNRARSIAAAKLLKLAMDGHDMHGLMDEAEVNNWKTFFPPRETFKTKPQKQKQTGAIYV